MAGFKYYEWGNLVGGVGPGSVPVTPPEASYGPAEDFSGTILAGAIEVITFTNPTKSVKVQNTHDLADFEVSVASGIYRTIGPYGEIEEPIKITSLTIRGGTADSAYYVRGALTE